MSLIAVLNGHGKTVGLLEVPREMLQRETIVLEWVVTRMHYPTSPLAFIHRIALKASPCTRNACCITTSWKQRDRLKRAGLLKPTSLLTGIPTP